MFNDNKINDLLDDIRKLEKETNYSAGTFRILKKDGFQYHFTNINLYIESKDFIILLERVKEYILTNRFYVKDKTMYYKKIRKFTLLKHNKLCRKIKV